MRLVAAVKSSRKYFNALVKADQTTKRRGGVAENGLVVIAAIAIRRFWC